VWGVGRGMRRYVRRVPLECNFQNELKDVFASKSCFVIVSVDIELGYAEF